MKAAPRNAWNQLLATYLALIAGLFSVPSGTQPLEQLKLVLLAVNPVVLAYFVSIFPSRRGLADHPHVLGFILGISVVLSAWILWDPEAFVARADPRPAGPTSLAIYIAALYTYSLWLLWSGYARERSEIMAGQARMVAVALAIPVLTHLALIPEEIFSQPWRYATALRIASLVPLYLLARFLALRAMDRHRRPDGADAWGVVGVSLGMIGAVWLLSNILLVSGAGVPGLADWTWSMSWLVFGFLFATGCVRLGAFDADPRALDLSLTFILSVGGALVVLYAVLFGGPIVAVIVAALTVFGAVELRNRMRPVVAAHLPQAATAPAVPSVRVEEGEAATSTQLGGFLEPLPDSSQAIGKRYVIVARLATGATGTILLAEDTRRGSRVVLKRLHADLGTRSQTLELVRRELRVAKRVSHGNLVALHGVLEDAGEIYLVEEFIEGSDLAGLLASGRELLPEQKRKIGHGLLEGLAALHQAGIVHGDLKPANVLVDRSGNAKLVDFGIVQFLHGKAEKTGGPRPGTLAYMAPEVAGGKPATRRSDVYAASAVLFELITGEHHLGNAAKSVPRLREALRSADGARTHKALSTELHAVLNKGLARRPEKRYADADEFLEAFTPIGG